MESPKYSNVKFLQTPDLGLSVGTNISTFTINRKRISLINVRSLNLILGP